MTLWKYVDSPTHNDDPYEDANLVVGHVWNAGPKHDGLRPLYIASNEIEQIGDKPVRLIRYYEASEEDLQGLLSS